MKTKTWATAIFILQLGCLGWSQTTEFVNAQFNKDGKRLNVAIFVFPGVQVIDFAGPYEVFLESGTNVYTVGEKLDPIQAAGGLTITPKYTFETTPKPDLLVLPGGGYYKPGDHGVGDQMVNPVAMRWIQETAKQTHVLTVCNGAFLAAKAGLLDGLSATTFYGYLSGLPEVSPTTKVVFDKKFVDNGNVVTTAGLSSGIEGSLHMVSKLLGNGHAQSTALNMEYNWNPDSGFARGMLADMNIPDELPDGLPKGSDLLSASGDRDHWTITVRIPSQEGAPAILRSIDASLVKSGKWFKATSPAGETVSGWNFSDHFGAKWLAVISLTPDQGSTLLLTLKIDRA
jgi:putative intracellular protease/amidase